MNFKTILQQAENEDVLPAQDILAELSIRSLL